MATKVATGAKQYVDEVMIPDLKALMSFLRTNHSKCIRKLSAKQVIRTLPNFHTYFCS